MKANCTRIWTPLYWHRRLLYEYVLTRAPQFLSAVRREYTEIPLHILDVGCGAMPYRDCFLSGEDTVYHGADVPWAGVKPEILINPKSQLIEVADASFHAVVHFQVMEHVPDYLLFLSECYRVLKPGGMMLFTVPFAFEYHGVPSDFRRWTHEGLKFDLERVGFENPTIEPVESDFLSVLTIGELYLAAKFGYRLTKPLVFGLNVLGMIGWPSERGRIPLTNGVRCSKRR